MKGGNAAKYEVIRHFIFHINSVVKVAKKMFTKIVTKTKFENSKISMCFSNYYCLSLSVFSRNFYDYITFTGTLPRFSLGSPEHEFSLQFEMEYYTSHLIHL